MIAQLVRLRLDDLDHLDPRFDLPAPRELRQVLVLASTQRTGSHMLGSALAGTGVAGVPGEYLSGFDNLADAPSYSRARQRFGLPVPTTLGWLGMVKRRLRRDPEWFACHRWRAGTLDRLLAEVARVRSTPNGVFALTVHASDFSRAQRTVGIDLSLLGAPIRWVSLERADLLAQAVSYVIAHQTRRWTSITVHGVRGEPHYDAARIEEGMRRMQASRDWWRQYFVDQGIDPLRFTYEDLVADLDGAARAVLALLGEHVDEVPAPLYERQANSLNAEWMERFRADRPDVVAELT